MGLIAMTVVGVVIVGLFFLNVIKSRQELSDMSPFMKYEEMIGIFLGLQGVLFVNITSMVMQGLNGVQLTCKSHTR